MGMYRFTIRLHTVDDHELIEALQNYPWGQRQAVIRQALRWYLVPGGFRDLLDTLQHLPQAALPEPAKSAPTPSDSPPSHSPPPTVLGDPTDVPLDALLQGPQTPEEQQAFAQTLEDMFKAFGDPS